MRGTNENVLQEIHSMRDVVQSQEQVVTDLTYNARKSTRAVAARLQGTLIACEESNLQSSEVLSTLQQPQ